MRQFYLPLSRRTQSQTVRAERRIISYPLKYIDVSRTADASLDGMLEETSKTVGTLMEIENCQIHWLVSQDSLY